MPITTRLSKPAGHLPASVLRHAKRREAGWNGFRAAKEAAGLASVVAYALLPLVIALVAMALLHDWSNTGGPRAAPSTGGTTFNSTQFVPAAAVAGTTQARAGSAESERPGSSGAERAGETAVTPLSNPLGSR